MSRLGEHGNGKDIMTGAMSIKGTAMCRMGRRMGGLMFTTQIGKVCEPYTRRAVSVVCCSKKGNIQLDQGMVLSISIIGIREFKI